MNKQKLKQFFESQGYEEISLENYFESNQEGLIQIGIVGDSLPLCFKLKVVGTKENSEATTKENRKSQETEIDKIIDNEFENHKERFSSAGKGKWEIMGYEIKRFTKNVLEQAIKKYQRERI